MRRVGLIAIAVAVTACGSSGSTSVSPAATLPPAVGAVQPAPGDVIEVLPDSEIARMLDTDVFAESWPVADGLSIEPGVGERWITSTTPPADDEVLVLATFFGIEGPIERLEDGAFGAEVRVGDLQGAGGALVVTNHSEPVWYLQPSEAMRRDAGLIPCPTLAFDDPNAGQCADGAAAVEAEPPTMAEAAEEADALMVAVGVRAAQYRVESFPSSDTVEVQITFGGSDAFGWNLTVGTDSEGEAVVVGGSGPLRGPTLLDEVPTVGLDEAVERLSRLVPGVPVDAPADAAPLPTQVLTVSTTADDGSVIGTVPPSTTVPDVLAIPLIEAAEPSFATIWDSQNRQWLVPALRLSGGNEFTTTVPTISADLIKVVDPGDISVPVRTGPPLTVPSDSPGEVPPPTTLSSPVSTPAPPSVPLPTGTAPPSSPVPTPPGQQPPMPQPTTTMPGTTLFPRPTMPGPNATLLSDGGTPITIPIPPDLNDVDPDAIPDFYEDSLNSVLVGRSLDDALRLLSATGWQTQVDDLDDPNEFFGDLRPNRVTVLHRRNVVVSIRIG